MKNKLNLFLTALVVLLALGLAVVGFLAFESNKKLKNAEANPAQVNQEKAQATVDRLKKVLFIEDDGKQPAVASVVDPEKLKESNKEFYKNVEKDDTLIVYPYRAIIFRESKNQIVNIAPIVSTTNAEGTVPKDATPAPAPVVTQPAPAVAPVTTPAPVKK
jgi:flagellar basal body-associated protein FliL